MMLTQIAASLPYTAAVFRRNIRESLLLLLAFCGACTGDDGFVHAEPGPCVPDRAIAEVGTGLTEFEPLASGQELAIMAGHQGGHHVVRNGRMSGLVPGDASDPGKADNPLTRFAMYRGDQPLHLAQASHPLGYADTLDGFHTLSSGRIVQFDPDLVAGLDGERIDVVIEIFDAAGACARDECPVTMFLAPPE
jgi:hypothetical protein